ncbi:hypothetical protein DSO57_1018966 [Entomophthora muscae]|uniref:Uncharacterized protein n=1 Tax=Entomophthora muscae TaxID=34485 RepID=A0ACC2TF91_9FUNG|nr:hypothetical protein DSO57_1018966 [Entomophthora muscae]
MQGISPKTMNRPVVSSPLMKEEAELHRSISLKSISGPPSTIFKISQRAAVRRSQTISQVFDLPPNDLSVSPMATAVFTGSEKPMPTKNFLSRRLKSKNSISSLSNISLRGPSIPATPRTSNKTPGLLKVGISFRDLHSCLSAEHSFKKTQPIALNGRYLIQKGTLQLEAEKGYHTVFIFLFNDCLVYGKSCQGDSKDLYDQKIINFTDSTLKTSSSGKLKFQISCPDESHSFIAKDKEDYENWTSVIKNVTTFYCTLSERKAKEDVKTFSHSRRSSVVSSSGSISDSKSRRSSFYNSLKDLVGAFI